MIITFIIHRLLARLIVIPFDAIDRDVLKTAELCKFANEVRDMKEKASHLLPFVLDMGKYLSISQAELLNDEDMQKVMSAIDESGLSLDGKSRMCHALNGYIVCKVCKHFVLTFKTF